MSGKGSGRRKGANDAAFKAAPWPPPSPMFRKATPPADDTDEWVGVELTEDGYIPLPKGSKPKDTSD